MNRVSTPPPSPMRGRLWNSCVPVQLHPVGMQVFVSRLKAPGVDYFTPMRYDSILKPLACVRVFSSPIRKNTEPSPRLRTRLPALTNPPFAFVFVFVFCCSLSPLRREGLPLGDLARCVHDPGGGRRSTADGASRGRGLRSPRQGSGERQHFSCLIITAFRDPWLLYDDLSLFFSSSFLICLPRSPRKASRMARQRCCILLHFISLFVFQLKKNRRVCRYVPLRAPCLLRRTGRNTCFALG